MTSWLKARLDPDLGWTLAAACIVSACAVLLYHISIIAPAGEAGHPF